MKRGRGRPKKTEVKGKRGRPRKINPDILKPVIDTVTIEQIFTPKEQIFTPKANEPEAQSSFCPDCGTELKDISIFDTEMDENCETYGCPNCNQEVTKDNEVTLTIGKDGMKLDYNSLTITKLDE